MQRNSIARALKPASTVLTIRVERPAYGGLSIGRHQGRIVMLAGPVLPGELVEAGLDEEKKDYLLASVKRIIEPSPERIEPACRFFGSCGGCHFQHIDYQRQVRLKEEILQDCLRRIAGLETGLREAFIGAEPWHYRRRGQFKAANGKVGFFQGKSRELIDIDACPLMSGEINKDLAKARALCQGLDIFEIHISRGDSAVVLLKTPDRQTDKQAMAAAVAGFLEAGFAGLCIQSTGGALQGHGRQYISLELDGLAYTVSPLTFLQSHWQLNRTVAAYIRQMLMSSARGRMLDLYAGAGNFSLLLAGEAEIVAVEENSQAVADGRRNLDLNNCRDYRFVCSPVEKYEITDGFDIVMLDPPRAGIAKKVIKMLLAARPERIVCLSCNPSTLARDLKRLLAGYDVESIGLVDFFPQTFHVETLAFLRRKYCPVKNVHL